MLVSHRKKFIYLKTKKTASTSIESFFEPYCLPDSQWSFEKFRPETVSESGIIGYRGTQQRKWFGLIRRRWFDHMNAKLVKRQLGQDIWDSYFKFTVVRNPFDKVISAFHFFAWMEQRGFHKMVVAKMDDEIEWFRAWVQVYIGQKRQVLDREIYTIGKDVCVDFFIRYENLNDDLLNVCNRLAIDPDLSRLPKLVGGVRPTSRPIRDYYDPPTQKVIEQVFDFELEYFDYDLPCD